MFWSLEGATGGKESLVPAAAMVGVFERMGVTEVTPWSFCRTVEIFLSFSRVVAVHISLTFL